MRPPPPGACCTPSPPKTKTSTNRVQSGMLTLQMCDRSAAPPQVPPLCMRVALHAGGFACGWLRMRLGCVHACVCVRAHLVALAALERLLGQVILSLAHRQLGAAQPVVLRAPYRSAVQACMHAAAIKHAPEPSACARICGGFTPVPHCCACCGCSGSMRLKPAAWHDGRPRCLHPPAHTASCAPWWPWCTHRGGLCLLVLGLQLLLLCQDLHAHIDRGQRATQVGDRHSGRACVGACMVYIHRPTTWCDP